GARELTFNLAKLGQAFFEEGASKRVNELLIYEFAHDTSGNHLDDAFYKALQCGGAKLTELAMRKPELFKKHGWR
ncbi:MAG TPA: hypothetical protein VJ376_17050, partial [Pseudomonadota bacterium]|nr:hypothetical protein [Pseudomonadota bacterium]